jgi:aminoglycoside phosphotransferase (APT) family kinase protein
MMNNSERILNQVSENLIAYLRTHLNKPDVNYAAPLTPIAGGYEAFTAHFRLVNVQPELAEPLVLRLFPTYQSPDKAVMESLVQNSLAAQGYPVPRVWFIGTDKTLLGGAFLIMDFLPGETMLVAAGEAMPLLLGKVQARLHTISPQPLQAALQAHGLAEPRYRRSGRLNWLSGKGETLPWLAESIDWLNENCPPEPEQLAICHGDFHPFNILVKAGRVTAVLDWPGFLIADPVLDVAFTTILGSVAAKQLMPGPDWDAVMAAYLAGYRRERPLDMAHFDYYRMLRCVIAFVDGAGGQAVWTSPAVLQSLAKHVYDIAGIRIVLSD